MEQIKLDFGYQGLEGTFVSVGGSYDYTSEGFTHHSPGDVQVMLTVPGMEVVVPGAPDELERLFRATYADGHPTYLRTGTAANARSLPVEVGRLDVVRRGETATVIAVGPMLDRTLEAVEGLDVTVLYVTTVSPFDAAGLAREAADAPGVITVTPFMEGTLTPLIAQALAHRPSRFESIGIGREVLREYGTPQEHERARGLDAASIRERIARFLGG